MSLPPPPPSEDDFYASPSSLPMPAPPEDLYQAPPPPPVEGQSWIPKNYVEKGRLEFNCFSQICIYLGHENLFFLVQEAGLLFEVIFLLGIFNASIVLYDKIHLKITKCYKLFSW